MNFPCNMIFSINEIYNSIKVLDFEIINSCVTAIKLFQLQVAFFPQPTVCCGYGINGDKTTGYDCVMVPGASSKLSGNVKSPSICGRRFVTASGNTAATICCELNFLVEYFKVENGFFIYEAQK